MDGMITGCTSPDLTPDFTGDPTDRVARDAVTYVRAAGAAVWPVDAAAATSSVVGTTTTRRLWCTRRDFRPRDALGRDATSDVGNVVTDSVLPVADDAVWDGGATFPFAGEEWSGRAVAAVGRRRGLELRCRMAEPAA